MPYFSKLVYMIWLNSLSKLQFVRYDNEMTLEPADTTHRDIHIMIIWCLYYIQILWMFCMMLNFLVAVIDQSYKNVD